MSEPAITTRPLSPEERRLIQWLLEHGTPEAQLFLDQLERASATSWKCPCGCASIDLAIDGQQSPGGGMHTLADFVFGDADYYGVFLYARDGMLAGLEVSGYGDEAPKVLPEPEVLRPIP